MKTLEIFDRPMCCASGVCGPQVDPVLPRFAADLQWLASLGVRVERYSLSQQPGAFANNAVVREAVAAAGTTCLPLIAIDGEIVSRAKYPSREALAQWTGVAERQASRSPLELPIAESTCCGGQSCC
jgi:hypothetical protein